jgi:hypothetical protein
MEFFPAPDQWGWRSQSCSRYNYNAGFLVLILFLASTEKNMCEVPPNN